MDKTSLWTRLGDWFRGVRRSLDWESDLLDGAVEGRTPASLAPVREPARFVEPPDRRSRNGSLRSRVAELESRSKALADAMEAIRIQLERQSENSQQTQRGFDRLATALSGIPETLRNHGQLLASLRDRTEIEAEAGRSLRDRVDRLDAMSSTLRDTAEKISAGFDESRQSAEAASAALEQLRQSVRQLLDASLANRHAVDALRSESAEKMERLNATLIDVQRRVTWFASAATAAALAALAVAVIALVG